MTKRQIRAARLDTMKRDKILAALREAPGCKLFKSLNALASTDLAVSDLALSRNLAVFFSDSGFFVPELMYPGQTSFRDRPSPNFNERSDYARHIVGQLPWILANQTWYAIRNALDIESDCRDESKLANRAFLYLSARWAGLPRL